MALDLPEKIYCDSRAALEAVKISDAENFFEIISENQNHFGLFEFVSPNFKSIEDVSQVIVHLMTFKADRKGANYGLWIDNVLSGLITINRIDWEASEAEVGYWLTSSATGQGWGLKALISLRDSLKEQGFYKLTAQTATTNRRSQKLLEKAGFKKGITISGSIVVRNKPVDEFVYFCNLR